MHAYTTYTGAREGRQTSAERVSGRGAHRHTPMTAAAEEWTRKVLSGWRDHRPARGGLDRRRVGLASDVPFCPRWFLFNALLGIEAGGTQGSSSSDRAQPLDPTQGFEQRTRSYACTKNFTCRISPCPQGGVKSEYCTFAFFWVCSSATCLGGLDRASRRRPMPLIILGRRRLRLDRRRKAWWLPPYHFWLR